MGNAAPPPMEDDVEGSIAIETIEFRKIWTGEDQYQMSKLVFKTSQNISRNFYYHDLLGIVAKAPLFNKNSLITSCNFTRECGENHIFRGIWEGEMKPNDTIKWNKSLPKEVTVYVRSEEELGSYIKDETKCDKFMNIKNSFVSGDKFRENGDGELHLEVTLNKYRRSKNSETQWAIYKLIIPQEAISSAITNATLSEKPKIVEQFIKKHDKKQQPPQKSIAFVDTTNANSVTVESVDANVNQSDGILKKTMETLTQQLAFVQNEKKQLEENLTKKINHLELEVNKLKEENVGLQKENLSLNEECKEYKTHLNDVQRKYNDLCRKDMLNNKNYKSWNSEMITDWILRLEPEHGAFDKYKHELRNKLKEEAVNGSHLASLTTTDLDRFGIKSFEHKQIVLQHIKKLISGSLDESYTDYSNEGKDSTHFSG